MKTLLFIVIFSLSSASVFADAEPGTYEFYTQSVDTFCKPASSDLWSKWKEESLIKNEQVKYADITKIEDGDREYKRYLAQIKTDPSKIDLIGLSLGPTFLEKASYVYKETMGRIYACAVMNAKVRIIGNMLKIPKTQSNITTKLTKQLALMRTKFDKEGCREIANTAESSFRKALLDNTTYQYCNYRQYLYYLDTTSKKSLDTYYKNKKGTTPNDTNPLVNTDIAASAMARSASKITAEIAHVKEVYPQAMVAFTEFEKTYPSHIILGFILQDYVDLRDSLKKLLNPIGQVIYKASNAQSPGK